MTKEQKKHRNLLMAMFTGAMAAKYEKGAKEHGGNLWDNKNLLGEATDEVIDLWTYLATLALQRPKCAYISAPFRAPKISDIEKNIKRAEALGRIVENKLGLEAVVVHPMIREQWGAKRANVHGGPVDQEIIKFNLKLLRSCDAVVVESGAHITIGMKGEIDEARRIGIPVVFLSLSERGN